jgi:hypothetical protein
MLSLGIPAGTALIRDTELLKLLDQLPLHLLLRIADYLAADLSNGYQGGLTKTALDSLAKILDSSSSRYELGETDGRRRLTERVPRGVQDAAEHAIATAGTAGAILGDAWADVHSLEPDDSSAYANAVKAVEVASFTALNVSRREPTLGDSIRALEADDSWRLPFRREHHKSPTHDVLLGLLRTLWRGHRDRHGSPDYSGVSHDEALAAVNMAVTLVSQGSCKVARRAADLLGCSRREVAIRGRIWAVASTDRRPGRSDLDGSRVLSMQVAGTAALRGT